MSDDDRSLPWAKHLRSTLEGLSIYDAPPPDPRYARLHANECPEPWPPEVMRTLGEVLAQIELGRYPDTSGRELRARLAERHDCDAERVVIGNGSDEIIALLLLALSSPERPGVVVTPTPTFVMYGHTARMLGMELREVVLTESLELPQDGSLERALRGATICFLARPNNPTGNLWDRRAIHALVSSHPDVLFVIDEAYIGYAPPGSSLWSPDGPSNQVHVGTLSKVGLAALRIGYCVVHPTLARALDTVRHPYNVSQTSLTLALTVLDRFTDVQAAMIDRARINRARLAEILASIPGATVLPSASNLVLVRLPGDDDAPALRAYLAARDVLVKDVSSQPRLERCLRVSVGTTADLDRLAAGIEAWSRDRGRPPSGPHHPAGAAS